MNYNWKKFWNFKALSNTDFQATGRSNVDIFGFFQTFHDIFNYLELKKKDNLLDIGCGSGIYSYLISNFVNSVTGIDVSQKMLNRAKKNTINLKNVEFKKMCASKLNFEGFFFDKVLIYSVLQYLDSIHSFKKVLENLNNIIKPNSKIYIAGIPDSKKQKKYCDYVKNNFTKDAKKIELEILDKYLWFDKKDLGIILNEMNLKYKFKPLNKNIFQSFYMFDCVIYGKK